MSLMRLLSMGRSLNEVKSVGRYHVPRELGLPQFRTGKLSVKAAAQPSPKPEAAQTAPVAASKTNGWFKRANPFAAPSAEGQATAPVQAELTLDKVKVVRNDLTEADFEIVPKQELPRQADIKPYRKRNQPAAVPAHDMLGAKAWNWLGSRLFGAAARH
jgi:hypothetical protein